MHIGSGLSSRRRRIEAFAIRYSVFGDDMRMHISSVGFFEKNINLQTADMCVKPKPIQCNALQNASQTALYTLRHIIQRGLLFLYV